MKEYKLIGETGFETPWKPLPAKADIRNFITKGIEREKLGRTYGLAIRETSSGHQ